MKKISIITILLLCCLVLFACKKQVKETKKDAESIQTEDTVDDTLEKTNDKEEQSVVEDEVKLSEDTTEKKQDNKTESTSALDEDIQNPSRDIGRVEDDVISNPTTDTKEDDIDTLEKQRYDQDGDGFVDGWH